MVGDDDLFSGQTPAQRAVGMRLAWGRLSFVANRGEYVDVHLLLHNEGDAGWLSEGVVEAVVDIVDDSGRTCASSSGKGVSDAPPYVFHVAGGAAITVHVIWPVDLHALPAGRYRVVAAMPEIGLRSEPAELEVVDPVLPFSSDLWDRYVAAVGTGPEVEDGPEEWARRCISRQLGVEVDTHDDGTELNPCALRLGPEGGPERMIDVVGAFDPAWAHTANSGPGRQAIPLPTVAGTWLVEVEKEASIDDLLGRLPQVLAAAAARGIDRLRSDRTPAELRELFREAGIHDGRRIRPDGPGRAHLVPHPAVSEPEVPETDVARWAGDFLRHPRQAGALISLEENPAPRREVFVVLTLTGAPWSVVSDLTGAVDGLRQLPVGAPDLPEPVTGVWIGSLVSFGEPLGVVWDGARWDFFSTWGQGIDDPVR